ncbi:MAG: hypothetical protein AB7G28_13370 [Pirellulales bacterium]
MRRLLVFLALLLALAACATTVRAQSADVVKTNPLKVYMHYMPWFDTPAVLGGNNWGYHWKMQTQNPNIVDESGKRQIASHYYPMIGPYQSSDPSVIEYHMLLMKYSGVDGIMMDWYGVQGTNGDIGLLLNNSNAIANKVDDFGLGFSVVMEDRFSANINQAKANMAYLRDNYFNKPDYIRLGAGDDPLVGVFGPINFQQPSQWTEILGQAGEDVNLLTLWYESADAGSNADGEYAWIYQDPNTTNHLTHTRNFYQSRANSLNIAGGAAYPGFNDFYQEGGAGNGYFTIPSNNGQTLAQTLALANTFSSRVDFLQLATFNDFGEGTMFEPTVETGFDYLKQVQQFTGVSYGEAELQLIYRLYMARKEYAGNAPIQDLLDQVASLLAQLEVSEATELLNTAAPAGDFNADGQVNEQDYVVWRSTFGSSTILYGSGADGNYNGKIDAADFTIWRNGMIEGGGAIIVPEPSALLLTMLAAAVVGQARMSIRQRFLAR